MTQQEQVAQELELETFEQVTEEDIISLWSSLRTAGLAENKAWDVILTRWALDLAFERSKSLPRSDH